MFRMLVCIRYGFARCTTFAWMQITTMSVLYGEKVNSVVEREQEHEEVPQISIKFKQYKDEQGLSFMCRSLLKINRGFHDRPV